MRVEVSQTLSQAVTTYQLTGFPFATRCPGSRRISWILCIQEACIDWYLVEKELRDLSWRIIPSLQHNFNFIHQPPNFHSIGVFGVDEN